ncbi:MAG: TldD/PmbA family protein [Pseudomonadota bacterium]
MFETIEREFRALSGEHDALRVMASESDRLTCVRGVLAPPQSRRDRGAMWSHWDEGALGYAASPDLSANGLRWARDEARRWARLARTHSSVRHPAFGNERGAFTAPVARPWVSAAPRERLELIEATAAQLNRDARVVNWLVGLRSLRTEEAFFTGRGGRVCQQIEYLFPSQHVTVHHKGETEQRSLWGDAAGRQGGLEVLDDVGFFSAPEPLLADALALLGAPNCPEGTMSVVLSPDQMILQLHESIGHPLELDRILGDERNYAGRSFVTLDMIGAHQYGSPLLNVTFDPGVSGELASYQFDHAGTKATRRYLIKDGVLVQPLGGRSSGYRAGQSALGNERAQNWNRPPIDRMANLNIEPGDSSFESLIAAVDDGVWMRTNSSWSIDDSRNKFQFGCEWAQRIRGGQLREVVRKPNYRGRSADFWRNLSGVGNQDTWDVLGTPNCGKGEPNQIIRVGHAAPACLFHHVEVFGGL